MASAEGRHLYGLVGAFTAVGIVFVVAAVVSQRATAQIDGEVADLQSNSLPSVTHLSAARNEIGHMLVELDAMGPAPQAARPAILERTKELRGALQRELDAAASTPWYPGERERYDQLLQPAVDRLDRDWSHLVTLGTAQGDAAWLEAVRGVFLDTDAVDRAVSQVLDINHEGGYRTTARILEQRRHSERIALVLELVSSLVALTAGWLAVRASRRFESVLQRNTQLQLARADELETFAQRVAHDLLSPMSAVVFSLGAIERRHPDGQTRETIQRALRSLERSRRMVHGIFHFARSGARPVPGARSRLGLSVRGAVEELLTAEAGAPPTVEITPFEDCDLACDEAVLGVMLSNLLSNAAKYTLESPERRIVVRPVVGRERVRIEVQDSGPGLPAGSETSIFEPYVRAPGVTQPGLGLGLATVKRFATSHGGSVGVRRMEGGTVFWFELPRSPDHAATQASTPDAAGAAQKSAITPSVDVS
ncbi:MAG TPA: HAMP domain-containing sensor histidine kinase [Polyangiaceae bacterium]